MSTQENNPNEELMNTEETKNVKKAPVVPKKTSASAKRKAAAGEDHDPEESIEAALNSTGDWLVKNAKGLLIGLAVIFVAAALYFGYKYIYMSNRAEKAGAAMYAAEQLFMEEDFQTALEGDGNNAGFLAVINDFGSTPQGNIARHYAGICYFKIGDMDNALKYLAEYKAVDGAPSALINAQNVGMQGDVYAQKAEYDKAAAMYKKAVDAANNVVTTPMYLKKLGFVYAKTGKPAEAAEAFQKIKDLHPSSLEARDIDKYIGLEEQR